MPYSDKSLSLAPPGHMSLSQRLGLGLLALGLLGLMIALFSQTASYIIPLIVGMATGTAALMLTTNRQKHKKNLAYSLLILSILSFVLPWLKLNTSPWVIFILVFIISSIGTILYAVGKYGSKPAGIRNDGIQNSEITKRNGTVAWVLAIVLTGFYVILYWYPQHLHGLIVITDPLSKAITGNATVFFHENGSVSHYNQWFLYGLVYTVAVLVMGFRFYLKYRHIRYQVIRTISVSFFQLVLAFLLPLFLEVMNSSDPGIYVHYFSYFWPLDYDALFPGTITTAGGFGKFVLYWTLILSFVAVPILTYFFGKRWYCSWVCGCGGLAETAGDPFRHLSSKTLRAWKIERILVYGILALITFLTLALIINAQWHLIPEGILGQVKQWYAFFIASSFAGVIGTGFYPILGSRVWCRFGCPQAAILGIFQKYLSRFRITTNGGQCISCGNCSTYCEMGIDVKWYAQREQNIVRASCVGCGICSAVCPRGVLKLENGPVGNRTERHINREAVRVLEKF